MKGSDEKSTAATSGTEAGKTGSALEDEGAAGGEELRRFPSTTGRRRRRAAPAGNPPGRCRCARNGGYHRRIAPALCQVSGPRPPGQARQVHHGTIHTLPCQVPLGKSPHNFLLLVDTIHLPILISKWFLKVLNPCSFTLGLGRFLVSIFHAYFIPIKIFEAYLKAEFKPDLNRSLGIKWWTVLAFLNYLSTFHNEIFYVWLSSKSYWLPMNITFSNCCKF